MEGYHEPVMLGEVIEALNVKADGKYVDCTLGGGGHSLEIAKKLSEKGVLISLDWDDDALNYVRNLKEENKVKCDWRLIKSSFSKLESVLSTEKIDFVDGILFDLGVSSHQLDEESRGFSFRFDSELDMRMDKNLQVKAVDLVNGLYAKELEKILRGYGEEPNARRIAKAIVEERNINKIKTTSELLSIIQKVVPFKVRKRTATRVFQALRIAVNDEIGNLQKGLPQALELLASQGRCVAISFHSLEDRVVKDTFREYEQSGKGKVITKNLILPDEEEIKRNPRSRSAKLRIFEKF